MLGPSIPDALLPTLRVLLARLVPADQDPGALELGAEAFIQERIAENPALLAVYEQGLSTLLEQRDPDPEFISIVAAHAVEAVYTHPTGLKMVGFEVTA